MINSDSISKLQRKFYETINNFDTIRFQLQISIFPFL